jgi:hypothetical protein
LIQCKAWQKTNVTSAPDSSAIGSNALARLIHSPDTSDLVSIFQSSSMLNFSHLHLCYFEAAIYYLFHFIINLRFPIVEYTFGTYCLLILRDIFLNWFCFTKANVQCNRQIFWTSTKKIR